MPFESQYRDAGRRAALYRQAIASVAALPGVEAVGGASAAPNLGGGDGDLELAVEDRPALPKGSNPTARYFDVSPGYFRALGIPLLRGRALTDADDLSSRRVALVNEAMARRFFAGEDPLGRVVTAVQWGDDYEIVGVVGNARAVALGSVTEPEIYVPYLQGPRFATYLIVRSAAPPDGLERAVRARIREIDPGVLVTNVAPLGSLIERELRAPRFRVLLVAAFALAAVLLAAAGVFSVVSYSTARRTHEIGVRVAVGAGREDVLRLVLAQGMRPVLAGAVLGLAGAVAADRALRGLLFEAPPLDVPSLAGAFAVVLLVGAVACALPAFRAAALDPVAALRWE